MDRYSESYAEYEADVLRSWVEAGKFEDYQTAEGKVDDNFPRIYELVETAVESEHFDVQQQALEELKTIVTQNSGLVMELGMLGLGMVAIDEIENNSEIGSEAYIVISEFLHNSEEGSEHRLAAGRTIKKILDHASYLDRISRG